MRATASDKNDSLYESEWWVRLAAITHNGIADNGKTSAGTNHHSEDKPVRSLVSIRASSWKNRLRRINPEIHFGLGILSRP